jgi:hypothetical protein
MTYKVEYSTETVESEVEVVNAPSRYAAKKFVKRAHLGAVILGMTQLDQEDGSGYEYGRFTGGREA